MRSPKSLFLCIIIAAAVGGCQSKEQIDFAVADIELIAGYVALAQPIVEAGGDATAVASARLMAGQLRANAQTRLAALDAQAQAIEAARAAMDAVGVLLVEYGKLNTSSQTEAANETATNN